MKKIIASMPMLIWLPRETGGVAAGGVVRWGSTVAISR